MTESIHLVKKGRREPRDGLVQQGKVQIGLVKKYANDLKKAGLSAEKMSALEAGVTALESKVSIQADERSMARDLTRSEKEALTGAKAFLRRLRTALPMALRDAPTVGVDAASFAAGRHLKQSTARVGAYLVKIRESVARIDDGLKPYFDGKKASEVLDAVKTTLDTADVEQEVKILGLPQDTLAVYETKGKVLEMIEDVNRIAKIAFDGQPERIAEFNKDVLKRARTRRTKSAKGKAAPKGEAPKAETPKGEAPKGEAPKAETPKAETPKGETPKAETPKGETPKAAPGNDAIA